MKERKVSLKRRSYLEAVCALVLQFLLYHSAACTVIGLFYESEHPEYYQMLLFFAIPILYLTLIRKYIKKFLLCLFLHLPVFCSVVFVGEDFGQKTVICVCTVIMAVISLHMCTMEKAADWLSARRETQAESSGLQWLSVLPENSFYPDSFL